MSDVDLGEFITAAEGTSADVVDPKDFDKFIAKASAINGCTL